MKPAAPLANVPGRESKIIFRRSRTPFAQRQKTDASPRCFILWNYFNPADQNFDPPQVLPHGFGLQKSSFCNL